MRMRVSRFLRWRLISWPAAWGIRWVTPSMATVSPSRMVSATACASDRKRDIADVLLEISVSSRVIFIYGPRPVRSNGAGKGLHQNAEQCTHGAHRVGRLRSRRHRVLSALFRHVRPLDHLADRA